MSTDTSRAIRVYASNVKDLYELIDDTYKDLLYCIKIVEDWLYKHGVPKLIIGIRDRLGGLGKVRFGELKLFDFVTPDDVLIEYHEGGMLKIWGVNPWGSRTNLGYTTTEFLMRKPSSYVRGTATPFVHVRYNTIVLLTNLGDTIGWDKLKAISKEVCDKAELDGRLYEVVDLLSRHRFKKVEYLYKLLIDKCPDVIGRRELETNIESIIYFTKLSISFEYSYFNRIIMLNITSTYRKKTVSVNFIKLYREFEEVILPEEFDCGYLLDAFDYWLSVYAYYYLIYGKLYEVLIGG